MKRSEQIRDLFMPWAGLVAGIVGGALAHQFGAEGMFDNCAAISPVPLLLVALVGLALAIIGGLESWRVIRGRAETPARKVVAIVSVGCAALFGFAIVLPMIAAMVIPPCFQ